MKFKHARNAQVITKTRFSSRWTGKQHYESFTYVIHGSKYRKFSITNINHIGPTVFWEYVSKTEGFAYYIYISASRPF